MQDTVYRAILNCTMQGIYSIKKWYNARILAYLQMVLVQNSTMQGPPCNFVGLLELSSASLGKL